MFGKAILPIFLFLSHTLLLGVDGFTFGPFLPSTLRLRNGIAFKTADKLWMSFIQKIVDDFGSDAVLDSTTYRPNYEKVDEVLDGTKGASTLVCN